MLRESRVMVILRGKKGASRGTLVKKQWEGWGKGIGKHITRRDYLLTCRGNKDAPERGEKSSSRGTLPKNRSKGNQI